MNICKHCGEFFLKKEIANHSRWCLSNPKRAEYSANMSKARSAKTLEGRKIAAKKVSLLHDQGRYSHLDRRNFLGKTHTDETKKILRDKALSSPHRRLKKNTVMYNGILLDSTWELELAKRLDSLDIKWIRPRPVKWVDDEGLEHNYFPDFYLPNYDLYLDPKNPHAVKVQKKKLEKILTLYKNLVIIESLEKCKNFMLGMA